MSLNADEFITRWKHLHLESYHLTTNSCTQPVQKEARIERHADIIRNTIGHLQFARLTNIAPVTCTNYMFLKYSDVYGTLIDAPTADNGLDNFADVVLSQTEGRLNESQHWKSSLTLTNVLQKDYVNHLLDKYVTVPDDPLPACMQLPAVTSQLAKSTPSINNAANQCTSHDMKNGSHGTGQMPDFSLSFADEDMTKSNNRLLFGGDKVSNSGRSFWNLAGNGARATNTQVGISGAQHTGYIPGPVRGSGNNANQKVPNQSIKRTWSENSEAQDDNKLPSSVSAFRTAKQQLILAEQMKHNGASQPSAFNYGTNKKSLGTRRGLSSKFVPPVMNRNEEEDGRRNEDSVARKVTTAVLGKKGTAVPNSDVVDERLKNLEPKMIELIMSEIMDHGPPVAWQDIAGLEFAKKTIKEIVVWPMLRPDIFTGLRGPPKGLLLFGPPGTGKTLIGKCIASQSKSTFFSISASSLTSKWVGEGEKMVRALFTVARVHQPAVIFIDEIDSLLSRRTDGEHEGSRRIKTEFLIQLEGATTGTDDRILVVGATNRPQEIDEAARRRFVKRLYIPLPEADARRQIVLNLMSQQPHSLTEDDVQSICVKSEGYSGSDMANLCREAALGPIRSMPFDDIENISADQVRPIVYQDFLDAFKQVRASVSQEDLDVYIDWNKQYGSWPA